MKCLLILVISLLLTGCVGEGGVCDKNAKQVKMAKSLSNEKLKKLYNDMKKLAIENRFQTFNGIEEIPEQFKYLNPRALNVEADMNAYLYLKVCGLDSKVLMFFSLSEQRKYIKLIWGDGPTAGNIQLWPKT